MLHRAIPRGLNSLQGIHKPHLRVFDENHIQIPQMQPENPEDVNELKLIMDEHMIENDTPDDMRIVNANSTKSTIVIELNSHGSAANKAMRDWIVVTRGKTSIYDVDTLPESITKNVVAFSRTAPNICSFVRRNEEAEITYNCIEMLKHDIPIMQIFNTLQSFIRDTQGHIYKENISSHKKPIYRLGFAKIFTNLSLIYILALRLGIISWPSIVGWINTMYKYNADAIREVEAGRVAQIYNPHSNYIFSSDNFRIVNGVKTPMLLPLQITVNAVRWAKTEEQKQMAGKPLFGESTDAEIAEKQRVIQTIPSKTDPGEFFETTTLYALIEYLKKEKGFENIFIRLMCCRVNEHDTEAATSLFKELGNIDDAAAGRDLVEIKHAAFYAMQQKQFEKLLIDNPDITTLGGASRRRTRAAIVKRRTSRTVRKLRRRRRRT